MKILTLDPSVEHGTVGTCLVDAETKQMTFKDHKDDNLSDLIKWIYNYVREVRPDKIVYENTNYVKLEARDLANVGTLFKVIGAIEALQYAFDFVQSSEFVYVRSVKLARSRIEKGQLWIDDLSYTIGRGNGWIFVHANPNPLIQDLLAKGEKDKIKDMGWLDEKRQRLSSHQLDAIIVYKIWTKEIEPEGDWEELRTISASANRQSYWRKRLR